MPSQETTVPRLSRQERFDLRLSRALPKLSGRANRMLIRASRGKLGTRKRGIPIALLTTTGRRSGQPRTVPLMYLEEAGRYLVVASNGGFDRPPAWFLNLLADPEATFEPGGAPVAVRARVVDDEERARMWPALVAHNPLWAWYQANTGRDTAVVSLDPS